jgi:predicted tellurium resistance membrane protein TerC
MGYKYEGLCEGAVNMKPEVKSLLAMTLAVISALVLFLKAQFHLNIVPEFNDFYVAFVALIFAVVGIIRNNRKVKQKLVKKSKP